MRLRFLNILSLLTSKLNDIDKSFLFMVVLGIYFSFAGILVDPEFIHRKDLLNYYIYGRIIFGSIDIIILILLFCKYDFDSLVISFLINMMVYAIHGQIFVPCYYLGYIEMLLAIGLFFPIKKSYYRSITIISMIAMILVIIFGNATYSTDVHLISKFKYDSISAILIVTIGAIIGHTYVTMARKEKDFLYNKFIDIGKNSAFILHDFKGMMSTPLVYAMLIDKNLKEKDIDKAIKNLNKLNLDLKEIERYAKEINKMTLPNGEIIKDNIKLSDVVASVKILLQKYLNNFEIIIEEDGEFQSDYGLILKILFNLTVNSINEFNINNMKNGKISIKLHNNTIIFKDNGKGFPDGFINRLNSNKVFFESNSGGSGLGLQIINGIANDLKIKLFFFNDNGAGVLIKL